LLPNSRLLCLLPVRNGGRHLAEYFENVRQFAYGIVALDDGSTDQTADLLQSESLVLEVLFNPRRESYEGWNDSENRQRLLNASWKFKPDWVLWLDADEVIAQCDVPLLCSLVTSVATPKLIYGFEVLRMIADLAHFDRCGLWVYRLFAYSRGQQLPVARLHFRPIPVNTPTENLRRTIIRILHKAGMTSEDRRARFLKYQQADPRRQWQPTYGDLLSAPTHLWKVRPHPQDADIVLLQPKSPQVNFVTPAQSK